MPSSTTQFKLKYKSKKNHNNMLSLANFSKHNMIEPWQVW